MNSVVSIKNLHKHYGEHSAVEGINLEIEQGSIVGLIGPNGAGKTSVLKSILGLMPYEGEIRVFDQDPNCQRHKLLNEVCFIADTSILPRWLKVNQAIEYVEGVHPKFNKEKAKKFIEKSSIKSNSKISELSKGMVTQLHLALIMSIEVKLLVLDEPTLGLDILFRKAFYDSLLNDYYDEDRTIIITTHQIEEIETLLTDLVFIKDGKVILNEKMESLPERYVELEVNNVSIEAARALNPISERSILGGSILMFETDNQDALKELGKLHQPSIADLFVAKMSTVK